MNNDSSLLALLFRYSQRRLVPGLSQVRAYFDNDDAAALATVSRLERRGLVYVQGLTVRLTLPGFAHAVAAASKPASVHRLGSVAHPLRSRAA